MLLDLAALVLLALCALLGAWRGAWASATALAALLGGYAAAVAGAVALGPSAAAWLGVPALLGAAAAGTACFLSAALTIGAGGRALRRAADARRGDAPRSLADRTAGVLLGAARGAVLVLLLGVAALWADAAREIAAPTAGAAPAADTPLRAATRAALERAVASAVSEEHETLAVRVATRPAETLAALQRVAEHPALLALADDPAFWGDVQAGRPDFALARPSFRALAADPALRADLAAAGAIDAAAAADPARFRAALRPVLVEVGPRIVSLRNDPELHRLAGDPALADALARRDVFAILRHPGLQRAVARALEAPPPG
jgi:uncharacterized membrane protein required for colicin V production